MESNLIIILPILIMFHFFQNNSIKKFLKVKSLLKIFLIMTNVYI